MTTRFLRRVLAVVSVLVLALTLYAQQIIVCPKCSYEAAPEAKFCTHCGAAIDPSREALVSTEPVQGGLVPSGAANLENDRTGGLATLVSEDIQIAVDFMTAKTGANPAAALVALNNARSILALAGKDAIPEKEKLAVMNGIVVAKEALTKTRSPCPKCNGKGQEEILHEYTALDGSLASMVSGKRPCSRCDGRGWIARLRKTTEIQSLLGTGRQQYADKALVKGRIKIGNAWVAPEIIDRLKVKEHVTLKHFSADPCLTCAGFGKIDCRACENTGFVPCTAVNCVKGYVRPAQTPKGSQKEKRIESIQLSSPIVCPECKGTALSVCKVCAGTASITCTTCNGSGERSPCTKCRGEGFMPCRECKGIGNDKQGAPCPLCSGEGIVLCTTCGGDGYGRK